MGIEYDRDYYDDKTLTLDEPLRFSRIGYDNFVAVDTVTVSSDLADFPGESLETSFTYDLWKPNVVPATITVDAGKQVTADYVGLGAHSLSGCEVTISYSTDGESYTVLREAVMITDRAAMFLFEPVTGRFWRVEILGWATEPTLEADFLAQEYSLGDYTDPGDLHLGVLFIGESLQMQRSMYGGHSPSTLSRQTEVRPIRSEGGQFLGRSTVRRGYRTSYTWEHLEAVWYRDNFDPFVESAREQPFFVAWRPEGFADEVIYGWTTGDIQPSNMGLRDFMSVTVNVEGHGDA